MYIEIAAGEIKLWSLNKITVSLVSYLPIGFNVRARTGMSVGRVAVHTGMRGS